MIYKGVAVTGTDTGVGKTACACAFCALFRNAGFRTGVLKPVETGCSGVPEDGLRLCRAAGLPVPGEGNDPVPWDDVVPWRFESPVAPWESARQEGVEISLDRIYQAMNLWMERCDAVIVETAGGLLVPLNPRFSNADLIKALALPVVVCGPNRLGVINHTLLTLEALARRGLNALAIVLSRLSDDFDASVSGNRSVLEGLTGLPVIEVPYTPAGRDTLREGLDAVSVSAYDSISPFFPAVLEGAEQEWVRVRRRYVRERSKGGKDEV
ncbi:MAG: dethiobiotin synthase [bacterium]